MVDENGDEFVLCVINNGDYDFIFFCFNFVVDVMDDIVLRFGVGKDICCFNFNDFLMLVIFSISFNLNVVIGNFNLMFEEVIFYDLVVEWYFVEVSVISVGIFYKIWKDLFVD